MYSTCKNANGVTAIYILGFPYVLIKMISDTCKHKYIHNITHIHAHQTGKKICSIRASTFSGKNETEESFVKTTSGKIASIRIDNHNGEQELLGFKFSITLPTFSQPFCCHFYILRALSAAMISKPNTSKIRNNLDV